MGFHIRSNHFWIFQPGTLFTAAATAGKKLHGVLKGFMRRFGTLFRLSEYDYVFIHREATPLGPAWFEWAAADCFIKRSFMISTMRSGLRGFQQITEVLNRSEISGK